MGRGGKHEEKRSLQDVLRKRLRSLSKPSKETKSTIKFPNFPNALAPGTDLRPKYQSTFLLQNLNYNLAETRGIHCGL